jgi:hypothetical protein
MFKKYIINSATMETPTFNTGSGGFPTVIITSGSWQGVIKVKFCLYGDDTFSDIPGLSFNDNFIRRLDEIPQYTDIKVYFSMLAMGEATIRARC